MNGGGQPRGADIWEVHGFLFFSDRKTLTFLCEVTFPLLSARNGLGKVNTTLFREEAWPRQRLCKRKLPSRLCQCEDVGLEPLAAILPSGKECSQASAGSRGEREPLDHQAPTETISSEFLLCLQESPAL